MESENRVEVALKNKMKTQIEKKFINDIRYFNEVRNGNKELLDGGGGGRERGRERGMSLMIMNA
jgi:hypothetical protein